MKKKWPKFIKIWRIFWEILNEYIYIINSKNNQFKKKKIAKHFKPQDLLRRAILRASLLALPTYQGKKDIIVLNALL
jgi:hypothetical protein